MIDIVRNDPTKAINITYRTEVKGQGQGAIANGGYIEKTVIPLNLEKTRRKTGDEYIVMRAINQDQELREYILNDANRVKKTRKKGVLAEIPAFIQSYKLVDNPGIDSTYYKKVSNSEFIKSSEIEKILDEFKSWPVEVQQKLSEKHGPTRDPNNPGVYTADIDKWVGELTVKELKELAKEMKC